MSGRLLCHADKSKCHVDVCKTELYEHIRSHAWSKRSSGSTQAGTKIEPNTADVTDGTVEHLDNPVEGRDGSARCRASRRKFERYETEDGEEFFVQVGTEESVWDLPEDGEVMNLLNHMGDVGRNGMKSSILSSKS